MLQAIPPQQFLHLTARIGPNLFFLEIILASHVYRYHLDSTLGNDLFEQNNTEKRKATSS